MATPSTSDASTILTVAEQSSDDAASFKSASVIDSPVGSTISSASLYTHSSGSHHYHSNSSRRQSQSDRTSSTSEVASNRASSGRRRGGARRKEGGRNSVSDSETSSYYTADWSSEHSEKSDSEESASYRAHSVRQKFIQAKLRVLKKSQHQDQRQKGTPEEAALGPPQTTTEEHLFCQNAIRVLGNKTHDTGLQMKRCDKTSRNFLSNDAYVLNDRETFNRLKIENLLSSIKKAASVNVSDGVNSCTHCSELQEASIRRDFIRQKTCKLKNELTEKKVDWLLHTQDPLTAIGELVQSLPKPSDDPSDVWDRLMNQRIT